MELITKGIGPMEEEVRNYFFWSSEGIGSLSVYITQDSWLQVLALKSTQVVGISLGFSGRGKLDSLPR